MSSPPTTVLQSNMSPRSKAAKMVQHILLKITLVFQQTKLALYQWILLWDLSRESEMGLLVLDQCYAQLPNAVKEVLMLPAGRSFLDYFFPPIRNKICYVVSPERLGLVYTFTEWAMKKLHLKETDTVAPFNCFYCYYVRTDERNYELFYRKV